MEVVLHLHGLVHGFCFFKLFPTGCIGLNFSTSEIRVTSTYPTADSRKHLYKISPIYS